MFSCWLFTYFSGWGRSRRAVRAPCVGTTTLSWTTGTSHCSGSSFRPTLGRSCQPSQSQNVLNAMIEWSLIWSLNFFRIYIWNQNINFGKSWRPFRIYLLMVDLDPFNRLRCLGSFTEMFFSKIRHGFRSMGIYCSHYITWVKIRTARATTLCVYSVKPSCVEIISANELFMWIWETKQ